MGNVGNVGNCDSVSITTDRCSTLAADILFGAEVAASELFWQGFRERLEDSETKNGTKQRRSECPSSFEPQVNAIERVS